MSLIFVFLSLSFGVISKGGILACLPTYKHTYMHTVYMHVIIHRCIMMVIMMSDWHDK